MSCDPCIHCLSARSVACPEGQPRDFVGSRHHLRRKVRDFVLHELNHVLYPSISSPSLSLCIAADEISLIGVRVLVDGTRSCCTLYLTNFEAVNSARRPVNRRSSLKEHVALAHLTSERMRAKDWHDATGQAQMPSPG